MSVKKEKPMLELSEAILADAARKEEASPAHFYEAKKPSLIRAWEMGFRDEALVEMFGFTLKPEDKPA